MNKEKLKEKLKKYQTYVLALLLVVSVVGITYAGFVITRESGENTLTTGQISMSYTEPDNAYVVENALPLKDSDGVGINKYFEFTVSSHARTNEDDNTGVTIPYNVTLGRLGIETGKLQLLEKEIKVYVTKVESGVETVVLQPTLISALKPDDNNNYVALTTSNTHKNGSSEITTTYRLRAWIDYGVEANKFTKDNRYQYKFNININSKVDAIGNAPVQSGTLLVEAIKQRGTVTTGDGLYMSNVTDSGDSTYYYRGQVDNNYVKLDGVVADICKYNGKQVSTFTGTGINPISSKDECEVKNVCSMMNYIYSVGLDETECNEFGGEYISATPTWKENDDLLWRVVRINEDGTTRIMLENLPITSAFNPSYNDKSYMYYTNSNVSGGAMQTLNNLYSAYLSSHDSKIAMSTYCESLVPYTQMNEGDSYEALDGFKCPVDENGKSTITSKVGLVSLSEVMHAGGIYWTPNDYYLLDGSAYWTTTPAGFDGNYARAFLVNFDGTVGGHDVSSSIGIALRPVISLNANVLVTGSGTDIDPWIVK